MSEGRARGEGRPNRLVHETSPYLLQHAHNPVDWYPWGDEALERARAEGKPILLSIGYAACHWCHVMERESFEDPETARLMNELFVSVKVDREERPDLDAIYMDAVQAMTGHGGWPLTAVLTPEGVPFFGGTYFPPEDRMGMPSFRRVLTAVADAWRQRREEIERDGRRMFEALVAQTTPRPTDEPLERELIEAGAAAISREFDPEFGGFGRAPKFPQPPVLELMLRYGAGPQRLGPDQAGSDRVDPARAREMVTFTLERMARGGIYDQVGGGFARYSVDRAWLVPHFEKMLYDNAQLARAFTHAWQLTHTPLFRRIALETLGYLLRDMRSPEGGFYASEDADSEGEEGRFYLWTYEEFEAVAPEAAGYYGVMAGGNFEGRNILVAAPSEEPPAEARRRLFEARARRVRPGRDEKILASWNGLAISALAEAGRALASPGLLDAARAAAGFVLEALTDGSGRLLHSYKDGRAKVTGLLEDHAYLAEGLLTLWEATFEPRWFEACERLCSQMVDLFWDEAEGGFFTTGSDHERLVARRKEIVESVTPSPNAVAALVLQKLAVLTGRDDLAGRALGVMRLAVPYMKRFPQACATFLAALDFHLSPPREIAIVGERAHENARALLGEVWGRFIPNRVLAGAPPGIASPLLEGKAPLDGVPTAFVCEGYACRAPTTDPAELGRQLAA